jgi:chromosome segregation ATPase
MANSDMGLKLAIEGESQFKSAIRDINQSFKVLGSEMQLVTSQFDKNDKSVNSLTSRNSVLNKEISTQKDKIETLKSALDNATDSFVENDKRTQNWQIQLNKAQAELNGMERELGENEKALEDVGDEMNATGKNADKLGDEVEDTGKDAEESGKKFEKLGGILKGVGVAIGTAMVAIGTSAVAAGKKMYDIASDLTLFFIALLMVIEKIKRKET